MMLATFLSRATPNCTRWLWGQRCLCGLPHHKFSKTVSRRMSTGSNSVTDAFPSKAGDTTCPKLARAHIVEKSSAKTKLGHYIPVSNSGDVIANPEDRLQFLPTLCNTHPHGQFDV